MRQQQKISVLLSVEEDARFCAYCIEKGFKKSTLVARLIRDHLDEQGFGSRNLNDQKWLDDNLKV